MQGTQATPHPARWHVPATLILPSVLSLGAYLLTGMDHLGPSSASAWTLAAHSAGFPADGWLSPLYAVLVRTVGALSSGSVFHALVTVNAVLTAVATALAGMLLYGLLSRRGVYGAGSLAAFSGSLLGLALPVWLIALVPNPAPLACALALLAIWLTDPVRTPRQRVLGTLAASLAVAALLPLLLLVPALAWWRRSSLSGLPLNLTLAALVLPLPLFFLMPYPEPILTSSGLFAYPSSLPLDKSIWQLLGSVAWQALTPVALLVAVPGLYGIIRSRTPHRIALGIGLLALAAWAALPSLRDVALLGMGALLTGLVIAGIVVMASRIPRGWIHLLWLVVPVLWAVQGPDVSRKGEDIWEIHARNHVFPLRYNCLIATTDHDVVLGPVLAWQLETGSRQDVLVLDPTRLHKAGYLEQLNLDGWLSSPESLAGLQRLREAVIGKPENESKRIAGEVFLEWAQRGREDFKGGLFASPGFELPGVSSVPEGILFRLGEAEPVQFVFRALDLGPIHGDAPHAAIDLDVVSGYADMFTYRFRYLSADTITLRALDYIRWALRIEPDHSGARHEAERYNIHGEPIVLHPAEPPRNKRALPGVSR